MTQSKETQIKNKILDASTILGLIAIILVLLLFVGWIGYGIANVIYDTKGPFAFDAKHIAYQLKDYTVRTRVNVLDIIKEKDKEPIYVIQLGVGEKHEITESTYMAYIGEDANTLTIEASQISMAVKAGKFGTTWDNAKTYTIYRYKMPWTQETTSFTEADVQQFFDLLCKDKLAFKSYNLPVKYHQYATGWDFNVDTTTEYTEWSNRTY